MTNKPLDEDLDVEVVDVEEFPKESKGPTFESLLKLTEASPYIKKILGEIDKEKLDVKTRLEKLGDMFAVSLRSFQTEGRVLTDQEKDYKKTLADFKINIEKLYLEESVREMLITKELIERADREYDLGKDTDRLEKGEKPEDPEAVAGILERQGWGKILTNLQEGDRVLSFMVPGADFLSIKYLNDKVMGPQNTNKIIVMKRHVIEQEMERRFRGNAELIQNDYKLEIFKIPNGTVLTDEQMAKNLEAVAKAVDVTMTAFVSKLTGDLIKQEREALKPLIIKRSEHNFESKEEKKKNRDEIKKLEKKIALLDKFNNDLHGKSESNHGKKGYQMNYGVSDDVVGSDPKDKVLALAQSLQAARIAREADTSYVAENGKEKIIYGAEYNEKKVLNELKKIKKLREGIVDSVIIDKDGYQFKVFSQEDGRFVLNKDLLRDVRKGKFVAQDDEVNNNILLSVSLYIKKLNLLDAVKPFVLSEIDGAAKNAEERKRLAFKIRAGESLDEEDRKKATKMLRSDEKDSIENKPNYTSKSEFSKKAIDMEDCAYVSLDVLDLGVDLLLEYEKILQEVDAVEDDKKMEKFNEMALGAGDETTEKLRMFREEVANTCRAIIGSEGLIVGEVGGDELTLAIDTSKVGEETLDELLRVLRQNKKINSRVIKTVVAKSEKKEFFPDDNHKKKVEAHLHAIKRAEHGSVIAKDIEEAERKLNRLFEAQGEDVVREKIGALRGLFVVENGKVKSSVVVVEKDGIFKIDKFKLVNDAKNEGYESMGYEFDYESIRDEVNNIVGKEDEDK